MAGAGAVRFLFRLATQLGIWDVRSMANQMDVRQLQAWMAYAAIEPFGEERADLRNAMMMALTANVHRDAKKTRAYKPHDFMPDFEKAALQDQNRRTPAVVWSDLKNKVVRLFGARKKTQ